MIDKPPARAAESFARVFDKEGELQRGGAASRMGTQNFRKGGCERGETIMRSRLIRLLTVALLTAGVIAAVPAGAGAHHGDDFEWYVATGPLAPICGEVPGACPAPAAAPNGDTIEISGWGTLSTHPKSAEGGGDFTHHFADGGSVSGTWEVTGLVSFKEWSPGGEGIPAAWRAGRAQFAVNLKVGPNVVGTGTLEVTCVLPGAKVPGSASEGIRFNLNGPINFNTSLIGLTLFVVPS